MNILLVTAYPDGRSFGGMLGRALLARLPAAGHSAEMSDLPRMNFPFIARPEQFRTRLDLDFFSLQDEQKFATLQATLPASIRREQDKIRAADTIIFLAPLYWASPPAMLRGWIEQVFTPGFAYDEGRHYRNGLLKGKAAFFAVTHNGKLGAATEAGVTAQVQALLRPLEDRPLRYSGMTTAPALSIHPPAWRDSDARRDALNQACDSVIEKLDGLAAQKQAGPGFLLIHINGRPGVGKKTIGAALAALTGAALIDNHLLLNPAFAACGRGSEGYYRINRAVREAVFEELVPELRSRPVILTNCLTEQVPEHRGIHEEIRLLAKKADARLAEIVLTAGFEENAARLETESRQKDFKLTDRGELARLYNEHSMITPQGALVLDTSGLSAEESARRIARFLKQKDPAP